MAAQVLVNSLITGGLYALIAFGFVLIYNTLRMIPFFYGALALWGGYFLFFFISHGLPFSVGLILAAAALILATVLLNSWLLQGFREKKASSVVLLILGLALGTFMENLTLAAFGPEVKSISLPFENTIFTVAGATFTLTQLVIILSSVPFLIFSFYLLYRTRWGLIIRALTTEPLMAEILGVDRERTFRRVFAFTGLVAALVGMLYAIEYNLEPTAGTSLIVKAFTAVVIGGMNVLPAAIFGGYLLGVIENLSVLFLPAAFKDGVTFIILFLFLLLRPKGIFGRKSREEISG